MVYDPSVPATGHSGSQDYNGMRGNFQQIQTSFSIDHEALGSGPGLEGFHKKSTYVAGTDPSAIANIGIVYTKTIGGHTELFYEGEITTGKILQITNQNLVAASGEAFIPGGVQIRFISGASLVGNNITQTFNYGTAFPTNTLIAFAIPDSADITHVIQFIVASSDKTKAAFKLNGGVNPTINIFALGY